MGEGSRRHPSWLAPHSLAKVRSNVVGSAGLDPQQSHRGQRTAPSAIGQGSNGGDLAADGAAPRSDDGPGAAFQLCD